MLKNNWINGIVNARKKQYKNSSNKNKSFSKRPIGIGPIKEFLIPTNKIYHKQIHLFGLIWRQQKLRLSRFANSAPIDDLVQIFEDLDWLEKKIRNVAISYLVFFIENVNIKRITAIIVSFSPAILKTLLATMEERYLKLVLANLDDNDILALVKQLPKPLFLRVINLCPNADQLRTYQNLQYNQNFIGSLMSREFITFPATMKIGNAIKFIRKNQATCRSESYCYIVDDNNYLISQLLIRDLFFERPNHLIETLCRDKPIDFSLMDDVEDVLNNFKKYNLFEAPIVNEKKIVGVISYDQIYAISVEEFTEDFQRIAGIDPLKENYLDTSVAKIVRSRIMWLFILMISATFSQIVIQSMQSVIGSKFITLFSAAATSNLVALFAIDSLIPVISGSAGNAGTQSSTTMIRSLALGHIRPHDYSRVLAKELSIAIIIGFLLSIFNFFRMLVYDLIYNSATSPNHVPTIHNYDWYIMIAFFFAINFTIIVSKVVGAAIPLAIHRIGKDPSVMSSPLLTTAIDAICNGATYALCILTFLSFHGFHAH